jgi:hypothetical protein
MLDIFAGEGGGLDVDEGHRQRWVSSGDSSPSTTATSNYAVHCLTKAAERTRYESDATGVAETRGNRCVVGEGAVYGGARAVVLRLVTSLYTMAENCGKHFGVYTEVLATYFRYLVTDW